MTFKYTQNAQFLIKFQPIKMFQRKLTDGWRHTSLFFKSKCLTSRFVFLNSALFGFPKFVHIMSIISECLPRVNAKFKPFSQQNRAQKRCCWLLTKAKVKVAYIFSIRSCFTFNVNDDDTHVWLQMRCVEPFQKSSIFLVFYLTFLLSF